MNPYESPSVQCKPGTYWHHAVFAAFFLWLIWQGTIFVLGIQDGMKHGGRMPNESALNAAIFAGGAVFLVVSFACLLLGARSLDRQCIELKMPD